MLPLRHHPSYMSCRIIILHFTALAITGALFTPVFSSKYVCLFHMLGILIRLAFLTLNLLFLEVGRLVEALSYQFHHWMRTLNGAAIAVLLC